MPLVFRKGSFGTGGPTRVRPTPMSARPRPVAEGGGGLWGWGRNHGGQIGNNTLTDSSSPVQIGALTNWSKISVDLTHAVSIKTDGTLWTWGNNDYGQLGLGNKTSYSSPKQVGSLTTWIAVSAGQDSCHAIRT